MSDGARAAIEVRGGYVPVDLAPILADAMLRALEANPDTDRIRVDVLRRPAQRPTTNAQPE